MTNQNIPGQVLQYFLCNNINQSFYSNSETLRIKASCFGKLIIHTTSEISISDEYYKTYFCIDDKDITRIINIDKFQHYSTFYKYFPTHGTAQNVYDVKILKNNIM